MFYLFKHLFNTTDMEQNNNPTQHRLKYRFLPDLRSLYYAINFTDTCPTWSTIKQTKQIVLPTDNNVEEQRVTWKSEPGEFTWAEGLSVESQ